MNQAAGKLGDAYLAPSGLSSLSRFTFLLVTNVNGSMNDFYGIYGHIIGNLPQSA